MNKQQQQIIALAGIFQAAKLVQQIARKGQFNQDDALHSLTSLFTYDAPSTEAVFGGIDNLEAGFSELEQQLRVPDKNRIEIPHLVIAIAILARKLRKATARLESMRTDLEAIENKLELYDICHSNTLAALAEVYRKHISDLSPRIMVKGEPVHLQNPENQNRIRSLLLAGIRSAVLWDQLGGGRMQLIFRRKQLLRTLLQVRNT